MDPDADVTIDTPCDADEDERSYRYHDNFDRFGALAMAMLEERELYLEMRDL